MGRVRPKIATDRRNYSGGFSGQRVGDSQHTLFAGGMSQMSQNPLRTFLAIVAAVVVGVPATCCGSEQISASAETIADDSANDVDLFLSLAAVEPRPDEWATPVSYLLQDGCACEPSCEAPGASAAARWRGEK